MSGRSRCEHSVSAMEWKAARLVPMTTSPRNIFRTSARPLWADTCLAAAMARGETIHGMVGGAKDPPFHMPVFVLTHHARDPIEMQGGTTFHFVTEGIHAALEQAKDAARGKDVNLGGGANVAQQYLKAGLIDEMEIHVVPVLLGDGARLFENTDGQANQLRVHSRR